jgi:Fur family transcriptional regulator, peroxide stress response regulator
MRPVDAIEGGRRRQRGAHAALRRALDQAGWRFTRQRAAVYDYLRDSDQHPTAEEVYSAVKRRIPRISLATVYKALDALVASRLASKIAHVDGPARYDCRQDAHYHMRCLRTGKIRDLPTPFDSSLIDKLDPSLVETLQEQGFSVVDYRLELLGYFDERR